MDPQNFHVVDFAQPLNKASGLTTRWRKLSRLGRLVFISALLLIILTLGGAVFALTSSHIKANLKSKQSATPSATVERGMRSNSSQTFTLPQKPNTVTSAVTTKQPTPGGGVSLKTATDAPGGASQTAVSAPAASSSQTTTSSQPVAPIGPLLGALAPTDSYAILAADGYREVVVLASWASLEPSNGTFSSSALASVQAAVTNAHNAGLSVSLDIGIQYAPSWVFSLPGGTYFEDQFGDSFSGTQSSGNYVPNAVTDMSVRTAMSQYLAYLGENVSFIDSVRLGGGPYNELRYPSGSAGSQPNAYWFYDSSSQASLPSDVRGWTPGTGTASQATEFLTAYNNAIVNYGDWLVQQGTADFNSSVKLELLLPGWGERPGEVAAAESSLLSSAPDEVHQGLDWADLLSSIGGDSQVVAYTTWGDSIFGSSTNPNPAAFIHSILPSGMLAGGESTGTGNTTNTGMDLMFQDAKNWNWYVTNFFFTGQPQTASEVAQAFTSQ